MVKKTIRIMVMALIISGVIWSESFAEETIRVNAQDYTFSNVYYLDATNGVDALDGGTKEKPLKTFQYFYDNISFEADSAVFFEDGVYNFEKYGHPTFPSFIAKNMGKATLISKQTWAWRTSFWFYDNAKIIGMNLVRDSDSVGSTYMFCGGYDSVGYNVEYYNCVIDGGTGYYRLVTFAGQATYSNCVFKTPITTHDGLVKITNCIYPLGTSPAVDATTSIDSATVTLDADGKVTAGTWQGIGTGTNSNGSPANVGIEGGLMMNYTEAGTPPPPPPTPPTPPTPSTPTEHVDGMEDSNRKFFKYYLGKSEDGRIKLMLVSKDGTSLNFKRDDILESGTNKFKADIYYINKNGVIKKLTK